MRAAPRAWAAEVSGRFAIGLRREGGLSSGMNQKVISFEYTLTDDSGQLIDQSEKGQPLTFLEGAGQIIPGLEAALLGFEIGARHTVKVGAADAYGAHDPQKLIEVPLERMPNREVSVGDQFGSGNHPLPLTAVKVTETHVTLDANHPLAGKDLTFEVEVVASREASSEEIAHGHVHGPGGHHH